MKNNLNFTEGEMTIYCGENAMTTVESSLQHASAISASGRRGNILYVNTAFSTRKIMAASRANVAEKAHEYQSDIFFQNVPIGELANYISVIHQQIESQKIKYVVINSWEFANKSYSYKEQAIFALMTLLNQLDITLLIYSQSKATPAGKIQRGGLGKLAALATDIFSLDVEKEATPNAQIAIPPTPNLEMLDNSKINNLGYAREEDVMEIRAELVSEEGVSEGSKYLENS